MAEEISGDGYPRRKVSWSSASAGQVTSTGAVPFTGGPDPALLACVMAKPCKEVCWRDVGGCPPLDLPADREPATIEEWLES